MKIIPIQDVSNVCLHASKQIPFNPDQRYETRHRRVEVAVRLLIDIPDLAEWGLRLSMKGTLLQEVTRHLRYFGYQIS